jgi:hypothetical protein
LARRAAREALEGIPGYRFTQVGHLDVLVELDLAQYQAIVLYYHHNRAEPEAIAALDKFVQKGGGILAVHSATASLSGWRARESCGL